MELGLLLVVWAASESERDRSDRRRRRYRSTTVSVEQSDWRRLYISPRTHVETELALLCDLGLRRVDLDAIVDRVSWRVVPRGRSPLLPVER
jgi:hypothetical protein